MLFLSSVICVLLIIANAITEYQIKGSVTEERLVNRKRVRSWWIIFLVLISVLYVGGWLFKFLLYSLSLWAVFEFSRLLKIKVSFLSVLLFFIGIIGYDALIHYADHDFLLIAFLLPFFLSAGALYFRNHLKIRIVFIVLFCVSSIGSVYIVSHLGEKNGYDEKLLILFLFFIAAASDISQYVSGKLWGNKKLVPRLSPGKTYEGALGGVIFTGFIFSLMFPGIINVSWVTSLLLGGAIVVTGILGDINVSFYKREANVKDAGASIPGHGGLLDRIDSLMFMAPMFGLYLFFNGSAGY